MNVLNILQYPAYNGPANTCLNINANLQLAGVNATSLIPTGSQILRAAHENYGNRYMEADLTRLRSVPNPVVQLRSIGTFSKTVNHIRVAIRELETDVVIVCGMENPHGAIAANLEGKKVIGQVLGLGIPGYVRRLVALWSRYTCDVGMMTGKSLYKYFPGFIPENKCVFFLPPVSSDTYSYTEKSFEFAKKYGIDTEKPVVGTVGNINPAKDYETFLIAASFIRKTVPTAQFLIKGNVLESQERYFGSLKKFAEELDIRLERDLFFVQDTDDSVSALSIMDVYVQSSSGEGVSTALLEAMSMTRPVIATEVGGTKDAVQDKHNGIIVPKGDSETISYEAIQILKNERLAQKLGMEARDFVIENASVKACANAHIQALEMVQSTID